MKILSIRLKNINSLRGEHYIPFYESPIADSGLFAIVGPTGAGKTSILDAITLALYGYAPRFGQASAERIMSYHTADCYAEAEFETKGRRYRSKWALWRSRNRLDGDMQPPKMELCEAEDGKLLASNVTTVRDMVTSLSGLDYPRFLRSVLLAQGDFAAFLRAKESEKGELLEKITGTDLYTRLSQQAHLREKREAEKLRELERRLDTSQMLTEEQLDEIARQIAELSARKEAAAAARQQLEAQRQWLAGVAELEAQHVALAQQLAAKRTEKDRFAEEFKRLEWHQQTVVYRPLLSEIQTIQSRAVKLENDIRELYAALPLAESACQETERLLREATERLTAAQTEHDEWLPKLEKAALVEKDLENLKARLLEAEQSYKEKEKRLAVAKAVEGFTSTLAEKPAIEGQNKAVAAAMQERTARLRELLADGDRATLLQREQALGTELERWNAQRSRAVRHHDERQALERLREQFKRLKTAVDNRIIEITALETQETQAKERLADLRRIHELELQVQSYEQARHQLQDGQPCPLCGATHHPFSAKNHESRPAEAADNLTKQQAVCDQLARQLAQLQSERSREQGILDQLHEQGLQAKSKLETLENDFRAESSVLGNFIEIHDETALETHIRQLADTRQTLRVRLQEHDRLVAETAYLEGKYELNQLRLQIVEDSTRLEKKRTEHRELTDGRDARQERKRLEQQLRAATEARDQAEAARRDKNNARQRQTAQLRDREQQLDGENGLLARKEKQLLDAIAKHDFDSIEALREVMLDEATETELRRQKETLDAAIGQLEGAWQQTDQTLRQRRANPLTTQGYEEITVRLAAEQRELETAIAETARLEQIRERHTATVRSNAETETAIAQQRTEHARWKALDQLIGSSRGDEFNKFAQGLTLAQLVQLANRYLDQLNTRYQIQRTPHTDLELEILDRDQADNIRPVKTLSGGETFLVSLALALGLSDIAGRKTRIESLFIDEGFGTLDPNALDTAITTLENLQATGKMIGIISHVEALKDRITTQVQVVRQPGGNSTIRING